MNSIDTRTEDITAELLTLCLEQNLLPEVELAGLAEADLFEEGLVDSLSLTLLQASVEETYGIAIPPELLVAELRSLTAVARYVAEELGDLAA